MLPYLYTIQIEECYFNGLPSCPLIVVSCNILFDKAVLLSQQIEPKITRLENNCISNEIHCQTN